MTNLGHCNTFTYRLYCAVWPIWMWDRSSNAIEQLRVVILMLWSIFEFCFIESFEVEMFKPPTLAVRCRIDRGSHCQQWFLHLQLILRPIRLVFMTHFLILAKSPCRKPTSITIKKAVKCIDLCHLSVTPHTAHCGRGPQLNISEYCNWYTFVSSWRSAWGA